MEVQSTFDYSFPNYECYQALKDHVLPNLKIVYSVGYSLLSVPLGKVNVKITEEHDPAGFIKGKMQLRAYNLLPYTVGPDLNFYCINTGNNLCTVEMSSEASVYGSYLMNLTSDIGKAMWPKFVLRAFPSVYFDEQVVYDKRTYLSESHRDDANVRAFKYMFRKAGKQLNQYLKKKFTT